MLHLLALLTFMLVRADVPYEMSYCFETQDCGISSLGSYLMDLPNNKTLSGHLYQIRNGLPFDVVFYWDVLGILSEGHQVKKAIKVKSGAARYFDSKIHTTHSVRLFIKNVDIPSDNTTSFQFEALDKVTGKEERKCGNGRKNKVCDFLFRLCYQNKFEDMEQCDEYEQACSEFATKTDEEECIESCALTHYSHLLDGAEKVTFKFDRYAIVKAIIDHEHGKQASLKWQSMMGIKTEESPDWLVKVAEIKASDDAALQSSNTTIAVLITIMVILIVFFVCGVWYWTRNYAKMSGKDHNEQLKGASYM